MIIEKALRELETNGTSYRKVAEKYGIPKSTIEFEKKHPIHKSTFGPSPVLTPEEEDTLVQWIFEMAKKGFPCKKEDILCLGAGSKETNTSDGETNNVLMDYRCFKSIVGEETIQKFGKIETILAQDDNDHFYKLYKLWQHFKAPRKLNSCKKINIIQDVTLKKHNEPAQKIMQSFDDNQNQKASTSGTIETEELTHQSVLSLDLNLDSIASTLVSRSIDAQYSNSSPRHSNNQNLPINFILHELNNELKENPSTPLSVNLSGNDTKLNVVKSELMGDYLAWPVSPTRKGKRETERFPFAITAKHNIPDDKDGDKFLCHICCKEDSDSYTSSISPGEDEDEPYEYDTEQTAKNIEGVAKEVHGIGTRKEKVMETYAEESDEENEKNYVDEDTDILLNMYQEETSSYNYKRNLPLS
ncbi:hypothetical protein JTB14_033646 [Gonioctena quinquepunctata]|nr:hypothetical protein JTB14_033646 [Gonioctena quinquepunctata]